MSDLVGNTENWFSHGPAHIKHNLFVSGGVLHSCGDGVCYLGDVNRLKKSTKEQIQSGSCFT